VTLPDRLRAFLPDIKFTSSGGPTETTVWDVWCPVGAVNPKWKSIPYGRPLTNAHYYILNDRLRPCPDWVTGTLYIGGTGLARGFWRDEERTQAAFIAHPRTGERLFRSGDTGRLRPDGNMEFMGRADLQVKIQGQRIELGEIEAALLQHEAVANAAVAAVGEDRAKRRLVAYVVLRSGAKASNDELTNFVSAKLPVHMVPSAFVTLERLPLTANGKVDRKALPAPADRVSTSEANTAVDRGSKSLARIIEIVTAILKMPNIDPDANLMSYGATSIDMVRIGNQLEKAFGSRPRMDQLFRLQTASALAGFYEPKREEPRIADSPLQGVAGSQLQRLLASFPAISQPSERDAFKDSQPGLRKDDSPRDTRELIPPPDTAERRQRYLRRRSYRKFSLKPVSWDALSGLLSGLQQLSLDDKPKYLYASAGGLYPIQTYLHMKAGRAEGLRPGVYYHHPVNHSLTLLTPDVEINRDIHVPFINTPTFDEAAFSIFFIAHMRAIAPMYGELSLHFTTMEAGLMSYLLETEAVKFGLGLCHMGSVQFERIRPWFHLDEGHVLIHSLLGGRVDEGAERFLPAANSTKAANPLANVLSRVKQLSDTEAKALLDANRKPARNAD
ncbi:MAG: AMP-binding enzyme, partial [Candidatus Acidiferrum sp.]